MILLQHGAQLRRDPLRKKNGDARSDAQKLDMRNGAQPAEQQLQLLVAEQKRVTAAEQHVADLRRATYVIDLFFELRVKVVSRGVADQPRTRAIPAVACAPIRDEEEHAVRIAMHETGNR